MLNFVIRIKQERKIENPHLRQNLPQAHSREPCTMKLTDPHFTYHVLFIPGHAARIKPERHIAIGGLFDFFGKTTHGFHP